MKLLCAALLFALASPLAYCDCFVITDQRGNYAVCSDDMDTIFFHQGLSAPIYTELDWLNPRVYSVVVLATPTTSQSIERHQTWNELPHSFLLFEGLQ